MKQTIDAELLAELCIAGVSPKHEDIANASEADFKAAIDWAAHTWQGVDPDRESEVGLGTTLPYMIIDLTPREVLERTMAVCRMAQSRGFPLLPPPELTAQCL